MQRTTVMLPPRLHAAAGERARSLGISFGEFVRRAIEREIAERAPKRARPRDPFRDDRAVYRGELPADYSSRHDSYLYGEG